MEKNFDPTNDNLFKVLFQNKEVAVSFIESFIDESVHVLELMPIEAKTNYERGKRIIFDYACLVNRNIMITVEMQKGFLSKKELVDRMGYYHFRGGSQLLSHGEAYEKRNTLYTIVLCANSPFPKGRYEREMNLQDYEHSLKFSNAHLIFYDLDAAYEKYYGQKVETLTSKQVWILYLMHRYKKMPSDYLKQLEERKEMKAVKMQTSKTDRKKLRALVKALDGMADDDVRHFQAIEKKYETAMKMLSEKDQKLLEKDQKLSEKDQKISALEQMIKKLQSPMLQS